MVRSRRYTEACVLLLGMLLPLTACQIGSARPTRTRWVTWTPARVLATVSPLTLTSPTAAPVATRIPTALPSPAPTGTLLPAVTPQAGVTASPTATGPASPVAAEPALPLLTSLTVTRSGRYTYMYAVIAGRLYLSSNKGYRWAEESRSGLAAGTQFNAIAADPQRPDTLYAATSQGVFRRLPKNNWEFLNSLRAGALAVNPKDSQVLWAGVGGAIYRSDNAGLAWTQADAGLESWRDLGITPVRSWVSDIVVHPNQPTVVWAVLRLETAESPPMGLLFRRQSDGRWQRLLLQQYEPRPNNLDSCEVAGIVYDSSMDQLFVGCDRSAYNRGRLLLLRSTNAGATDPDALRWEAISRFAAPTTPCTAPGFVRPLALDLQDPKSLYLASAISDCGQLTGNRFWLSHNDGRNWSVLNVQGIP